MTEYRKGKSSGVVGLLCELYIYSPHLFDNLLANVYCNWQQNGIIPSSVGHGVVVQLCKDSNKGNHIGKVWSITLLNAEFKILTKALEKRLALVVGGRVVKM